MRSKKLNVVLIAIIMMVVVVELDGRVSRAEQSIANAAMQASALAMHWGAMQLNTNHGNCLVQAITAMNDASLADSGSAAAQTTSGYDENGFSLWVERSNSLSDLIFTWEGPESVKYDAFNVRVRISDGREGQVEVRGGSYGRYRERNAEVGRTYIFMVQGCNKGASSSDCTGWSQFKFRNVRR